MKTDDPFLSGGLLRVPLEYVLKRMMAHFHEAGLPGPVSSDFFIFGHMRRSNGIRLVDLARKAQTSKQSMLYSVNRLANLGYIERIPDPINERSCLS